MIAVHTKEALQSGPKHSAAGRQHFALHCGPAQKPRSFSKSEQHGATGWCNSYPPTQEAIFCSFGASRVAVAN